MKIKSIEEAEELPLYVSSRKSTLKVLGGDLSDLSDSQKFDQPYARSRSNSGHTSHKDFRGSSKAKAYRPWQRIKALVPMRASAYEE